MTGFHDLKMAFLRNEAGEFTVALKWTFDGAPEGLGGRGATMEAAALHLCQQLNTYIEAKCDGVARYSSVNAAADTDKYLSAAIG